MSGYGTCPFCGSDIAARERSPDGDDVCAGPKRHKYPHRLTVPPDSPASALGPGVMHITCQADRITLTKDGQTVQVDADHFDTFAANVRAGGGA